MSLLSNNKKDNKKGNNAQKNATQGGKFNAVKSKNTNAGKKPIKTGGTRGS